MAHAMENHTCAHATRTLQGIVTRIGWVCRAHQRRLLCLVSVLCAAGIAQPSTRDGELYENEVRPILAQRCVDCHGPDKARSGLRVDSIDGLLRGGERGPALVPGHPEQSLFVRAIRYEHELRMPERQKLPPEEIAILERWVSDGAPGPRGTSAAPDSSQSTRFDLEARRDSHWAWSQLSDPAPPRPSALSADRPQGAAPQASHPIDRFIEAELERAGIEPAPPAAPELVLRRLTFDLTGLPPSIEELRDFREQSAIDPDQAYEQALERLLASPHYSERWARHWLDLVRYAETKGHEFDYPIANAWRYRDYVVRAFDSDVPYDRFVQEHLAGDLLADPRPHTTAGWNESILGTGFWFLGEEKHSPVDTRLEESDRVANQIDVLSKAFLGLTVACARCHDHKFDAISTRDYYALAGYSLSASYRQVRFESLEENTRIANELDALERRYADEIRRASAAALERSVQEARPYLSAALERGASDEPLQSQPLAEDTSRLEAWIQSLASAPSSTKSQSDDGERGTPEPSRSIFPDPEGNAWIQDGVRFGIRPRQAGEVRLGTSSTRPIERVFDRTGAWADPSWSAIAPSEGNEKDGGKIDWVQAGQTLRTRTFTLEAASLWYLVEGEGMAFAEVESHRLVAGPLHGATIRSLALEDADEAPVDTARLERRWVEHDLRDYVGRRMHVEFTPSARGEFGVLAVVAGADPPNAQVGEADPLQRLLAALGSESTDGTAVESPLREDRIEQQIEAFIERCASAARWLGETPSAASVLASDDAELARLCDAMLRRPTLFPLPWFGANPSVSAYVRERQALEAQIVVHSATAPALLEANGIDEFILARGDVRSPQEPAARGFLSALEGSSNDENGRGSGRLALARALTDAQRNPFFARVRVNRVWKHLFGRGLVATVDNFGATGEEPTHPELLDWLASRFVADGYSQRALLRRILTSRTYRRSSRIHPAAQLEDPTNRLLSHMPVRRLEGEAIRDAMLFVSGTLDRTRFGPPVPLFLTEFMEGRGRPEESGPLLGNGRRSLYLAVRRNFLNPFFQTFDFPTPATTIGRRTNSNVPSQALTLLNSPLVLELAELWARNTASGERTDAERIEGLYLQAFARAPDPEELQLMLGFLEGADTSSERWSDLCHVLFNSTEFFYLH